jgi:hypothetical protein
MNASNRFGFALLLLAAISPLNAQPGRHGHTPRPLTRQGVSPMPGRASPAYIDHDPTPTPPHNPDKRWGLGVILGVFAIPIAIVLIASRRAQPVKPPEGLARAAVAPAPDQRNAPASAAETCPLPPADREGILDRLPPSGGIRTLDP